MIRTTDGILWARMPDPPFEGEPWIGYREQDVKDGELMRDDAVLLIPTARESELLNMIEGYQRLIEEEAEITGLDGPSPVSPEDLR